MVGSARIGRIKRRVNVERAGEPRRAESAKKELELSIECAQV